MWRGQSYRFIHKNLGEVFFSYTHSSMMYLASRHVRQMIPPNNVINYYVATFIQGHLKEIYLMIITSTDITIPACNREDVFIKGYDE